MMFTLRANLFFHFLYVFLLFILVGERITSELGAYLFYTCLLIIILGVPVYYILYSVARRVSNVLEKRVKLFITFYTIYYLVLLSFFSYEPLYIHKVIFFFYSEAKDFLWKSHLSYIVSWLSLFVYVSYNKAKEADDKKKNQL